MAYKSIIAPKSIDLLQLIFKIQNPQKKIVMQEQQIKIKGAL